MKRPLLFNLLIFTRLVWHRLFHDALVIGIVQSSYEVNLRRARIIEACRLLAVHGTRECNI
jgi:hypothetical protein